MVRPARFEPGTFPLGGGGTRAFATFPAIPLPYLAICKLRFAQLSILKVSQRTKWRRWPVRTKHQVNAVIEHILPYIGPVDGTILTHTV
jgi:hypothetical protein